MNEEKLSTEKYLDQSKLSDLQAFEMQVENYKKEKFQETGEGVQAKRFFAWPKWLIAVCCLFVFIGLSGMWNGLEGLFQLTSVQMNGLSEAANGMPGPLNDLKIAMAKYRSDNFLLFGGIGAIGVLAASLLLASTAGLVCRINKAQMFATYACGLAALFHCGNSVTSYLELNHTKDKVNTVLVCAIDDQASTQNT